MDPQDVAHEAQEKIVETLNADGRSLRHVVAGAAICALLVSVSAAMAAARPVPPSPGAEPERGPFLRAIWPAVFSVTTLAALRIWNAPPSQHRTQALSLWSVLQASNLAMTFWRPRTRQARFVAAATTAALTTAYVRAAAEVDQKAATMTAPTGFDGLSAIMAEPRHG